ncbi:MAG: hypothetical protein WB341_06265 [Terracidiphilus sp.]
MPKRNLLAAILIGALLAPGLPAQATNPSYLAEFPSVDAVMNGMKTADPDETASRQMAAFTWLMQMILDMAGPRQFLRGPQGLTPDENNLRLAYNTALYNMQKSNPKYSAPGPMQQLKFSLVFRNQMIRALFPATFPAEYDKVVAQAQQARAQLHQQAVAASQAREKAAQPAVQQAFDQFRQQYEAQQKEMNMDPQAREVRRCVTSGRVMAVCTGNALMGSLMPNVNGLLSSLAPGQVGKEVTGPQFAGVFQGAGWRLDFSEASVAVSCQDMIPDSHAYTIAFSNNRAVLSIASTPANIALSFNGDTFTGPAPVVVDGRIALGVRQGKDPVSGKNATIYSYERVTRTCSKPLLTKSSSPGVVGAEQNLVVSMFNDGDSGPPTPAGLRMNGVYAAASGGFSVEFFPESAILGCGPDVARAYPYTVVANGSELAIKIAATDHPLTLAIKPNNTLDPGPGSYLVQGRFITGQNANGDYIFVPRTATCSLAPLAPGKVPSIPYFPPPQTASAQ